MKNAEVTSAVFMKYVMISARSAGRMYIYYTVIKKKYNPLWGEPRFS